MAVLGWLIIAAITVWLAAVSVFWAYASIGLTGKLSKENAIPVVLFAVFAYMAYEFVPFTVTVTQ